MSLWKCVLSKGSSCDSTLGGGEIGAESVAEWSYVCVGYSDRVA